MRAPFLLMTVQSELQSLIRLQEERLLSSIPAGDKRLPLLQLVRAGDYYFLADKTTVPENHQEFFSYGYSKALGFVVDRYRDLEGAPLFPSNRELHAWALAVIENSGGIALCERLLAYERAGLGILEKVGPNQIRFSFPPGPIGLENLEVLDFYAVRDLIQKNQQQIRDHLSAVEPGIHDQMRRLVKPWQEHYIQYETNPEIDSFYDHQGLLTVQLMAGHDSFPATASFGGLPFGLYCSAVGALAGWALKHINFAQLLHRQHPTLDPQNLLTVTVDLGILAHHLSVALGCSSETGSQLLQVLELNEENRTWCCGDRGAPPPLVRDSSTQAIKSMLGCLNAPFWFMLGNLRRRHEKDWDRAVNLRENVFRDQLYRFFPQERIFKSSGPVRIAEGTQIITDVDAFICDPENGVAALFQLKWQDPFGTSMRQRETRKINFLSEANQWVERVSEVLPRMTAERYSRCFGIRIDQAKNIKKHRLIVLGRNFSHFSCTSPPDSRAVWGAWHQVIRLMNHSYDSGNPVEWLFDALKKDTPYNRAVSQIE